MNLRTTRRLAASVSAALLLAACGGGGDSADPLGDTAPATDEGTEISDPLPKADETAGDDPASGGAAENPNYDAGGSEGVAEGEPNPNAPDEQTAACSAGDMMVAAVQPTGVSEEAAQTWNRMRSLAMSCDFEGLAELGQEGDFSFSFGGGDDPAEFWRQAEANGEPVMAYLVQITGLTAVDDEGTFVWPAAHVSPDTDDVWNELEGIYPPDQLEQWREMESYLGHRVGITADGDWTYFIAGD